MMIAVEPVPIATSNIISTTTVDAPNWSATATYAKDAKVCYLDTTYQSVADSNTGNSPDSSPTWWVSIGPRNTIAMFDSSPSSATVGTPGQTLSVKFSPGQRVTTIGFLALNCLSIRLRVFDGATVLLDETKTTVTSNGTYYSWAFENLRSSTEALWMTAPSSVNEAIQIDLAPIGTTAPSCGLCVVGKSFYLGAATWGFNQSVELRASSYLDSNGNPVRIDRGWRKTISGTLEIPKTSFNRVSEFLGQMVGKPMLWALDEAQQDYRSTTLFGDYEKSVLTITDYATTTVSIDINGYY